MLFPFLFSEVLNDLVKVQHIVPEVTIPPEVTPENVTTYIVDSGGMRPCRTRQSGSTECETHLAGPQDRTHLESELRKAHVICIVYSIDNPGSFDRIPTYWLPHIRQLGVNVCHSHLYHHYNGQEGTDSSM